jgi:phosphoribosylamine---glycine ligase
MSMNVLIIGSGGREHALAWKAAQSRRVHKVWVAPGNGGTQRAGGKIENVPLSTADLPGLATFARSAGADLTIVGPETPLAAGIVDLFQQQGLAVFGPTQAAARIEASKVFAKDFMARHGIPTARYAAFNEYEPARRYLQNVGYPVVIKASGLAAGKGVIIPDTPEQAQAALSAVIQQREFGAAGDSVVIEERLSGPEVSLLAFCDGASASPMPPAQDHKRAYDGDTGPNTGGMGAYAPAPVATPALISAAMRDIIQPAVSGLAAEGMPYVGVLYAGLMLTPAGVKVLEFNCRFGDPETQAILPLLESDLIDVVAACVAGGLSGARPRWSSGSAAVVVLASGGYPGDYRTGVPISGIAEAEAIPGVTVFQAGTSMTGAGPVTSGGRVLNVAGTGDDVAQALERAYSGVARISFAGMHYRRDIGARAMADLPKEHTS